MMIDGKGCWLIVIGLAILGLFIGLLVGWMFSLPWWVPLVGASLPFGAAGVLIVLLILGWMSGGSH